jgi:uncharacterized protein (DUF924 family)
VSDPAATDVLQFWLGSSTGEPPSADTRTRWWKKDEAFDAEIRRRFGTLHERACIGGLDDWAESPRGCLALVIVLDQFSRNLHRGSPRAWAQDDQALEHVERALARGDDGELAPFERLFLYMPMMHAEHLAAQNRCVEVIGTLAREAPEPLRAGFENNLDFAVQHRDIIERFGRFPHRNEVLGRTSTAEELEFLKQPGSSF